ncbi:STAS domain-containing protein [Spirochaeta lutea]|uniref:MlaB-like STAS domain-containing protein n=1 Tax=Spirochaeta lutea TaxID=1480694 RepID=A0A098R1M5_9SPIO|nr:STAS domain-containing protein [Spirochaeta lutea]KGE73849.1 hypothetical protein DC28_01145 [Spirochaeta lutea]
MKRELSVLPLPRDCTIAHIPELLKTCKALIQKKSPIMVQTGDVESMDLSGIQILLALKKTQATRSLELAFTEPLSTSFVKALTDAGIIQQEHLTPQELGKIFDQWVEEGMV